MDIIVRKGELVLSSVEICQYLQKDHNSFKQSIKTLSLTGVEYGIDGCYYFTRKALEELFTHQPEGEKKERYKQAFFGAFDAAEAKLATTAVPDQTTQPSTGQLVLRHYLGKDIQFEIVDGQVYANATEMCQVFGKRFPNWWANDQTKRYINALTKTGNPVLTDNQLVIVKHGGSNPGSWIHEKLILRLASWLNVDFEIWCDMQISELLKTGTASIQQVPKFVLPDFTNPIIAARAWADECEAKQIALQRVAEQEAKIVELIPKAEYTEKVLQSTSSITTTVIAKELGMTAQALNQKLRDLGIQYKRGRTGPWVLSEKYQDMGYVEFDTYLFEGQNGYGSTHLMKWTEKGRLMIHEQVNPFRKKRLQVEHLVA